METNSSIVERQIDFELFFNYVTRKYIGEILCR